MWMMSRAETFQTRTSSTKQQSLPHGRLCYSTSHPSGGHTPQQGYDPNLQRLSQPPYKLPLLYSQQPYSHLLLHSLLPDNLRQLPLQYLYRSLPIFFTTFFAIIVLIYYLLPLALSNLSFASASWRSIRCFSAALLTFGLESRFCSS